MQDISRCRFYYLYDRAGNRYLDCTLNQGRALLGRRNGLTVRLAQSVLPKGLDLSYIHFKKSYQARLQQCCWQLWPKAKRFFLLDYAFICEHFSQMSWLEKQGWEDFPSVQDIQQGHFVYWRPFYPLYGQKQKYVVALLPCDLTLSYFLLVQLEDAPDVDQLVTLWPDSNKQQSRPEYQKLWISPSISVLGLLSYIESFQNTLRWLSQSPEQQKFYQGFAGKSNRKWTKTVPKALYAGVDEQYIHPLWWPYWQQWETPCWDQWGPYLTWNQGQTNYDPMVQQMAQQGFIVPDHSHHHTILPALATLSQQKKWMQLFSTLVD